ncbi:MAG: hypothetical protein AB1489_19915 [Acidobacteriota bacterium]
MSRFSIRLTILIATLLLLVGQSVLTEGNVYAATNRNHIILLDASGSMKAQYTAGLRDWLIAPLLESGVFQAGDRVILRTFDKRGNNQFVKDDPQRRYQGLYDRNAVLAAVPTAAESTGRNTAIPEALELALADLQTYNLTGDTLIWLVTDNVQDESGSGNDPISPFYQRIYNDPNFRFIYFFPLVREGETTALVMYMLDYCKTESLIPMPSLIAQVGKTIGHRPVLFRPIRLSALDLDRGSILYEKDDGTIQAAELEDGRIVVPLSAGSTLSGKLKFKLRSKFREWRIVQANVSNAQVVIEPSQSLDISEGDSLQWRLDPRTLDIGPQETSKRVYVIDLASGRTLAAALPSFWQSFFAEPEVRVSGTVKFEILDPQLRLLFFDDTELADRIRRVKGLEEIEQFLLPRTIPTAARNLSLEIPILIKIAQPPRSLWLLIVPAGLLLLAMVGGLAMLRGQTPFRLLGPNGEALLKLRPLASVPLTIADEQVGVLVRRFGTFTVQTFSPWVLENGSQKQRLIDHSGAFVITNSDTNKSWSFSIEALADKEQSVPASNNDMFIS